MACAECDRIEEAAEREMDIFEKRITELEAEVEKQQTMRRNALRILEELRPELNDTVHDLKLENQCLRAEVERLKSYSQKLVDSALSENKAELVQEIDRLRSALEQAWREISSGGAGIERAKVTLAQALEGG